ncbi:alpha/beta-hydrolase [Macroventuria anomochaeta]|uniref:Alpha/beta-hydrolase n=2 Tax=Macroventuria anomochaeta TaxID=301207 RepID=A0ACB6RIM8_9PLEO|nr:alpha/beta-hydrolase [Macroventuria anomochaeta]XP_033555954.1 alpha/beta-hydrolase [Macroventuria anomochaeta]KAF2621155.1 alpha/beta-hydrolase [Macroventuria anomochaeta]KAF2621751.1 alpha/beta-hydrolase [Macroventuria anomochaeta]
MPMNMFILRSLVALSPFALAASAAFPPKPEHVTIVQSTKFPGVSISYKKTSICETTEGVTGYSGFVNLPIDLAKNRNYESHIYFWFFQARHDAENAPLSIWLQGGPGVPSSQAAVGENGPCIVLEDSKTTKLNPWSWNDKVNMVYIDQPLQVGYSYDRLVNGTLDVVSSPFAYKPANFSQTGVPETNLTFLTGTFPSQNFCSTPNTTVAAAPFIYDFMQTWMQEFPGYKSKDNRFSIWGESYAGHYNPIYADYFEQQNSLIAGGSLKGSAIELHIDTIGLVNACIDIDTQIDYYPEFAYNNTYGLQFINETQYESALAASPQCKNLTAECRTLAEAKDPRGLGNQPDVNKACLDAFLYCFSNLHDDFDKSGQNKFDIAAPNLPETLPPKWAAGYLNDADIQQALGVPLNWTGLSFPVAVGFNATGDFVLGNGLKKLSNLLEKGVKVSLVYGDRDYQCNWLGGEAIGLALGSADFKKAGYADIQTNSSNVGGFVRQHGNLSFARVFQAGHEVPYYQPETAYQIFNRVMFNKDVPTGEVAAADYSSCGSSSAWTESVLHLDEEPAKCYLWDVFETCTEAEKVILRSVNAIVKDFILVGEVGGNGTNSFGA